MIPYLIPLIIVIGAIIQYDLGGHKKYRKVVWCFLFVYVVLLIGLRYRVGIDTLNYMLSYNEIPTISSFKVSDFTMGYQPFYLLLCVLARSISSEFFVLQLLHTFILNLCVFYFISKYAEKRFMGLFFYFIMYFLYFNTEIMKESLAIGVFLVNYGSFKERKWFRFFIGVFIAMMFHVSAVIIVLFPFLNKLRMNRLFLLLLFLFYILILSLDSYLSLFSYFETVNNKVSAYMYFSDFSPMSIRWTIFLFIQCVVMPLSVLCYLKYYKKQTVLFENLICIQILLGIGVVKYEIIFARLTNYLMPFYSLMIANMVALIYAKKQYRDLVFVLIISAVFSVYSYDFLSHDKYKFWVPYNSVLNPKENREREKMWEIRFDI